MTLDPPEDIVPKTRAEIEIAAGLIGIRSGTIRQWYRVGPAVFHHRRGNLSTTRGHQCHAGGPIRVIGTHCLYEVNLVPCGAQDFAHPRGGEFQCPGGDTFLTKLRECIASTSR